MPEKTNCPGCGIEVPESWREEFFSGWTSCGWCGITLWQGEEKEMPNA